VGTVIGFNLPIRLTFKSYKCQLLQCSATQDKEVRYSFCCDVHPRN